MFLVNILGLHCNVTTGKPPASTSNQGTLPPAVDDKDIFNPFTDNFLGQSSHSGAESLVPVVLEDRCMANEDNDNESGKKEKRSGPTKQIKGSQKKGGELLLFDVPTMDHTCTVRGKTC